MTPLGRGIDRAFKRSPFTSVTQMCDAWGLSYCIVKPWMNGAEPMWLGTLRAIRRHTRMSYDELLDGRDRTARRVVVSNHATECATGHCECGECGGSVNPYARFCEHCGRRLVDE